MDHNILLQVPSIHCPSCKTYLESILGSLSLINLRVDVEQRTISYSLPEKISQEDVEKAIKQAGYAVAEHAPKDSSRSGLWHISRLTSPDFGSKRAAKRQKREHLEHCLKCQMDSGKLSFDSDAPLQGVLVSEPTPKLKETVFGVEGMTCSSCTQAIHSAISGHPSVDSVVVMLLQHSMKVVYDSSALSLADIVGMVEDVGYGAAEWETRDLDSAARPSKSNRAIQIHIDGMFCPECPSRLNAHLATLPLLSFTPVTLNDRITTITYKPNPNLSIRTILKSLPPPFVGSLFQPPTLYSRSRALQLREAKRLTWLFVVSTVFVIPTFIVGVVGMLLVPEHSDFRMWCERRDWWGGVSHGVLLLWILATFVQFGIGRVFFERAFAFHVKGGWRNWRLSKFVRFNMDLLVALSTGVAYVSSVAMMVLDIRKTPEAGPDMTSQTYFDSCVFLVWFILLGRVIEGRARVSTGDAIEMLGNMRPEKALLVVEDLKSSDTTLQDAHDTDLGFIRTIEIAVDDLELGDRILLRPGAVPPADGPIVQGSTTIDESSLTGESLPVLKHQNDQLFTGTTNLTSPVIMRVATLGDTTALQQIVRAVAESQNKKAPIEKLADKIIGTFVPAVVIFALCVLAVWLALALIPGAIPQSYLPQNPATDADRIFFAFEFFIAVVVIACPCGIGLAAPTAQAVGAGMAARAGILAQGGGEAFQMATKVDVAVFDKTGTLTLGEARVTDVDVLSEEHAGWIMRAVRLVEAGSGHPLAVAVVKRCEEEEDEKDGGNDVVLVRSEEVAGKGARGVVRVGEVEYDIAVGNEALMVGVPHADPSRVEGWKAEGKSIVLVSISTHLLPSTPILAARLALSDTPRPEAASTIAALRSSGKEVYMLSGDNVTTARAVALRLGIEPENVVAGVLPAEKAAFVRELQGRMRVDRKWWAFWGKGDKMRKSVVLFCGDGLNDSAAIAAADVGVALSHGSQITLTSASFVLLQTQTSLSSIAVLLRLSRKVYLRQKINFLWASIYNLGMIPLAAGVFYPLWNTRIPPVWSSLAMALSSLSVVMSSLALKWGL